MPTGNYMGIGYGYVQSVEPSCLMGARFQYVTPSLQRVLGWDETDPAHEGSPRGGDPTDPTKKEETQDAGLTLRQSHNTGKRTTRSLIGITGSWPVERLQLAVART